MFVRLGRALIILALAGATGLPWGILQTVAWSTMLANNLRTHSLADAVERTFDGKHPCSLCKAVAKGRQQEEKSKASTSIRHLDFVCERYAIVFAPPTDYRLLKEHNKFLPERSSEPPVPPPRSFPG